MPADENMAGEIERLLNRFPEIIEKSLKELAPQHISSYLLAVASAFNKYYAETKIVDHSPEVAYKLNLVRAVMTVVKNGLFVLGIRVSEKM
jgi:arginyl-tRNA synthetase